MTASPKVWRIVRIRLTARSACASGEELVGGSGQLPEFCRAADRPGGLLEPDQPVPFKVIEVLANRHGGDAQLRRQCGRVQNVFILAKAAMTSAAIKQAL